MIEETRTKLGQLTLELTDVCNLRCKYCVFGGGYTNQRSHGTGFMAQATVERAIDYFYANNGLAPVVSLGFYGGEPLHAYRMMQFAIKKALEYERGPETDFHMTTNGTQLTPDKFPFLVDHRVSLLVSVDGPRRIHDRYRRDAGSNPTHKRVLKNLRSLRDYHPEFYSEKVMISAVRAPATSIETLLRYFTTNELFRGQTVQMATVSGGNPKLLCELASEVSDWDARERESDRLLQEYVDRIRSGKRNGARFRLLQSLFGGDFLKFHRRSICGGPRTSAGWHGMCIPGGRKLFVSVDGKLWTCERIDRDSPIGHIDTGLDDDAVLAYLSQHEQLLDKRCRKCWAVRLCGACQASVGDCLSGDDDALDRYCSAERDRLAVSLRLYVRILEKTPSAFDHLDELSVG